MEIPKYIVDKIRKQNEAVFKAQRLEREIDNWCDKSGIDIYSNEYDRNVRGSIADAVSPMDVEYLQKIADKINFHNGDNTLKNRQAIAIIEDISKQHTNPAEQRAFEKAIAALQYCGNLTYYTETKRFGNKPDTRKIKEYIGELNAEIDRLESDL